MEELSAGQATTLLRNEQEIDRATAEMEEMEETLLESLRWVGCLTISCCRDRASCGPWRLCFCCKSCVRFVTCSVAIIRHGTSKPCPARAPVLVQWHPLQPKAWMWVSPYPATPLPHSQGLDKEQGGCSCRRRRGSAEEAKAAGP